jgi:hypothetical protein
MNYILGYLFIGLFFTMFFEFIFQVLDKEGHDLKFDGYGERLLFLLFWPLIVYFFMEQLIHNK